LIKEGSNIANRKAFGENTKEGSQKQLGHPLASKTPLHGEHPHLTHLTKGKKKKKPNKLPKTLMSFKGQQQEERNPKSKLEGNQIEHL